MGLRGRVRRRVGGGGMEAKKDCTRNMKAETVVLKLAIAVALTVALECPAASFLPPTNLQQPAQVINSPTAQTVDAGRPVVFYGSATGDMPLFCQWQHDGQNIPGTELYTATNGGPIYLPTSLSLASASSNDAGRYQFVVSNGFGMATSASAVLTVIYRPPVFLASPVDQSVYWGGTVTFACNVAGGPPPALQWFHNGSPLPGATASYLYPFQLESTNQAGVYSVVASNALGSVTSAVAHLTILLATPTFLTQPASLRVVEGEMAAFSAVAFGAPPPNCQWLSNGVPITGATNTAVSPSPNYSYGSQAETLLTFGGVTAAAADYTVVACNEAGCATSSVASLVVSHPVPLDRLRK